MKLHRGDWSYGTSSHNLICKTWIDEVFGPQGLDIEVDILDVPEPGCTRISLKRLPGLLPSYIVRVGSGEPTLKVLYPTLANMFKSDCTVWIRVSTI